MLLLYFLFDVSNGISRMCYLLRCKYNIYVNIKQEKEKNFSYIREFYGVFFRIYIKLYIFAPKFKYNVYVKS